MNLYDILESNLIYKKHFFSNDTAILKYKNIMLPTILYLKRKKEITSL